jgi:GntR family transcriptional regulator/MocR family aminotransferase
MELSINLKDNKKETYYIQIYQYIKEAILHDHIHADERIPSIRVLSKNLSVSRTTIENAYAQLLAEGYIYSLPQKGYYASNIQNDYMSIEDKKVIATIEASRENIYSYDFKNEYVETSIFNFNIWKKHVNDIINYQQQNLYSYGDVQGERTLRKEILNYIFKTRGITADENHIIVGAGIQSLFNILSQILWMKDINKLGMEDPGFNRAKSIFGHNHFNIVPININKNGIDIEEIKKNNARLCYVTPSYQFPMGTVMLVDNRMKLIKWAYDNQGYIIEDDFNSELRYEGKPIPAMKGLDIYDRVIYIGSFSGLLLPSIRISFMILPDDLQTLFNSIKHEYSQTASKVDQLALGNMMSSGDFERHIRRIRKHYALKHRLIVSEIERYFNGIAIIRGSKSGYNLLVEFTISICLEDVIKACQAAGVLIATIDEYSVNKKNEPSILLNYRGITEENLKIGIKKLYKIVEACRK